MFCHNRMLVSPFKSYVRRRICSIAALRQKEQTDSSVSETSPETEPSSSSEESTSTIERENVYELFSETDVFRQDIYEEFKEKTALKELEESAEFMDESEKQRADVSGLKPWHRINLKGEVPSMDFFDWQWNRSQLKERFAKYGKASGVNPGLMWPTSDELAQKKAEYSHQNTNLFESLRIVQEKREERKKLVEQRTKQIEANMAKYPKVLEEYNEAQRILKQETLDAEAKKKERIREIQEYFGYEMDINDPRFKDMHEKKLEEEKKAERAVLKKKRQDRSVARYESSLADIKNI